MIKRYIDLVSGAAKRSPDATAVVADHVRLTFSELNQRVGRLGSAMRSAGLKTGDRVALLAANELEYVEIQTACLRSGFAMVPLNIRLALPELEFILNDCEPALLIGGRREHDRIKELAPTGSFKKVIGLGDSSSIAPYDDFISGALPDPSADPLASDLACTILYTSGTTGRPKGAVIDRKGLTARVFINALELESSSDDIFVACLPMFHIAAFLAYASVFRGGTVVMLPEFTPETCFNLLKKEKATSLVLVPTMIRMLLDSPAIEGFDHSSLRLIVYG
ncbi:MAG: AMP-binding protein, partial [Deltaproteobacteria bacterium]|nr:AMP-binding protein [Deltaproteobacteria bacterium]